ncbi:MULTISPECIES: hypothetical protein [Amycolatopsis]|uniref:Uncharacterized protein n=1 Tax=Amycolatopsis albidoflavus TaxID=102226 RepID=A0ABW5IAR3_9PSEU
MKNAIPAAYDSGESAPCQQFPLRPGRFRSDNNQDVSTRPGVAPGTKKPPETIFRRFSASIDD